MPATIEDIRSYWTNSAQTLVDSDGLRPTARDPYLQAAVESAMEPRIPLGCFLFDFGCGDGESTARFAKRASKTVGFDYIDAYVEAARMRYPALTFEQANVLALGPVTDKHGYCDVAISIRCLINLPTWELQKQAIDQIRDTMQTGGTYLLSEGWQEGWDGLNATRKQLGLPPMNLVPYNRLISRRDLEEYIAGKFEIMDYVNLGFYIFMSRVFQPAFVAPDQPSHKHPVNKTAQRILEMGVGMEAFKDVDYAGVYILRKK